VVSELASKSRVSALAKRVRVFVAPLVQSSKFDVSFRPVSRPSTLDLRWLLKTLGAEDVTSLLVEGGGEINASFLLQGLAHRIAFFYAPKILGGRRAVPAVGGAGVPRLDEALRLTDIQWRNLGADLMLTARILK
jgi:riboflavin biosynthesis pyrimidine reductase